MSQAPPTQAELRHAWIIAGLYESYRTDPRADGIAWPRMRETFANLSTAFGEQWTMRHEPRWDK